MLCHGRHYNAYVHFFSEGKSSLCYIIRNIRKKVINVPWAYTPLGKYNFKKNYLEYIFKKNGLLVWHVDDVDANWYVMLCSHSGLKQHILTSIFPMWHITNSKDIFY